MTITEAVDVENTLAQSFYKKEEQKDNLEILLMVLSAYDTAPFLCRYTRHDNVFFHTTIYNRDNSAKRQRNDDCTNANWPTQ